MCAIFGCVGAGFDFWKVEQARIVAIPEPLSISTVSEGVFRLRIASVIVGGYVEVALAKAIASVVLISVYGGIELENSRADVPVERSFPLHCGMGPSVKSFGEVTETGSTEMRVVVSCR